LDIRVGQDITWDRRGNKWEAHTSCWLNSSPEARERIIRKQQQSTLQKLASEKYKEWEQKQERKIEIPTFSESEPESEPEVDVDFPEVTPSEDKEVIPPGINIEMENEDEEPSTTFIPPKPITLKKCITFYDSVYLMIQARIHAYIYGPAGCGKSHIVEQASHAYGLSFSSISLNVQTMPSMLLGFLDMKGDYQSTDFRRIYENGGVFLIDEMDNASGNLLTTLNSALANRFLQFPDGFVRMHQDCVVIATGNTTGRGKTAQYISRQTLDAATLDRFVYLSHTYDEQLERSLAEGTNHLEEKTTGKVEFVLCLDSFKRIQFQKAISKIRANAEKHKLSVIVSYRPTVTGCKLLNHYDRDTLLEMLVFKGTDADTKLKLMEGVY